LKQTNPLILKDEKEGLMAYGLHHIHIITGDLQQMMDFFRECFDVKEIAKAKFGAADGASFELDGVTINLRVANENETFHDGAAGKPYGWHHIGIIVDDLDATYRKLTDKGYAFSVPPSETDSGVRFAFFDGPESLTFELVQRNP
jgi:catechol 2,3-dioxygenase-like lactoylglutathione lyase family enzyme